MPRHATSLFTHIAEVERLYRAHPAQRALEQLHRYLYPERYSEVPTYEWHAGTIEDVAALLEQALPDAPSAPQRNRPNKP
jgi:hypothetical protein